MKPVRGCLGDAHRFFSILPANQVTRVTSQAISEAIVAKPIEKSGAKTKTSFVIQSGQSVWALGEE
jgi:hypothetical protein